ncbi:MAG TPA: NAD-dependent epimerase/dehydratase family protein [Armatimonadota bacterium]|jgi:nucleoside-diphosphate-sugar epimerase|nr:NAD-dependent epimerase/dehydratase family protein [Armatimonadota bacterium]HOM82223.1 NAD-dependent epimerase/dehydratase family protein [Armatimonadota bacterium]HPO72192.1 NAD-dependent epimerase/dehydratase family protein [Armatimonadota bacterium]
MHCVVTGAAGFIGSHLCEALLAGGHTVIGIDVFTDYYPRAQKERNLAGLRGRPGFTFVEGDLREVDLPRLLEGAEWVFHQAAQAGVRASWGDYFSTYTAHNVLATQMLLEAVRKMPVRKLVYASSSSIYGDAERAPTPEETIPQPVSPYGVTKLAAEHLCFAYARNFNVPAVALRYFTVYGERQRPDMAFHRFLRMALSGEPVPVYGDGLQSREFTYVSDVVKANLLAAEHGRPGTPYNIGGGSQVTVAEVLDLMGELLGRPVARQMLPAQPGDVRRTQADITRARTELGYEPTVGLREGLRRELEWLRGT